MYKGKTILALIPARGGSKGLPGKNIRPLLGKPLVAWTIQEAKKSAYLDRIVLSSEDSKIIAVARQWGCDVPFVRPKELAKDSTPGIAPVLHALGALREKYDFVLMLQPTSPLRSARDIDGCIRQCISGRYKACVSVTEPENSPYWMFSMGEDRAIRPIIKFKKIPDRRQKLPKTYVLNGALYIADCRAIHEKRTFIFKGTAGYVMPPERSIDIDSEADLKAAEVFLSNFVKRPVGAGGRQA